MKLYKGRVAFFIILSFTILRFQSFAQNITAQKVIDRFIELSGGRNYINELKATGATAKGVFSGDSVLFTMIKVAPHKMYIKYQVSNKGTFEIVYNNGKAVLKRDGENTLINDELQLEELQVQSFLLTDMAYEKLGYEVNLLSSEDDSTYKIEVVSPHKRSTFKYYDKAKGYLTKIVFPEGTASLFYNYSVFEKFTISTMERTINAKGDMEDFQITDFTINPKFDPSIFEF